MLALTLTDTSRSPLNASSSYPSVPHAIGVLEKKLCFDSHQCARKWCRDVGLEVRTDVIHAVRSLSRLELQEGSDSVTGSPATRIGLWSFDVFVFMPSTVGTGSDSLLRRTFGPQSVLSSPQNVGSDGEQSGSSVTSSGYKSPAQPACRRGSDREVC